MERKEISSKILRFGMAIVFLYFGFQQIISPDLWASFVPGFISGGIITANNLVIMNGIVEITLGIFLIIGLYTKLSSLVLSIHLLFIALSMGISPISVRDFGLSIATFIIFLTPEDEWTLDSRYNKRKSN